MVKVAFSPRRGDTAETGSEREQLREKGDRDRRFGISLFGGDAPEQRRK